MTIYEVEAKSLLRRHKRIDSWFISGCGMNFYRGCSHNCIYCDGRSEKYHVEGEFGEDVTVKINAMDLLKKELGSQATLFPKKEGFLMLGGGVGDSYQPIEKKYELTRKALELVRDRSLPAQLLTKSTLIDRDLDLIREINERNMAIVSFSFSSMDDDISAIFEPGVPPPSKRLETLRRFKDAGVPTGMYLMPVIPHMTDSIELIEASIKSAKKTGVELIIFGGMTLKEGRQKDGFMEVLGEHYPDHVAKYRTLYRGSKWGEADPGYYDIINRRFNSLAGKYQVPTRIPPHLFKDLLDRKNLVIVILEHLDYLFRAKGNVSPYGYAARSIANLKEPIYSIKGDLQKLKGVDDSTESIILEILKTGTSRFYEGLIYGR